MFVWLFSLMDSSIMIGRIHVVLEVFTFFENLCIFNKTLEFFLFMISNDFSTLGADCSSDSDSDFDFSVDYLDSSAGSSSFFWLGSYFLFVCVIIFY